jgi:hypothetical protein
VLGEAIDMEMEGAGGAAMGMERDLDADVLEQENADLGPEMDSDEEEDDDEDEEEEEDDEEMEFEDEPQGERDLDDEVPEASGEYEHTDTNIEDTSGISVAPPSASTGARFGAAGALQAVSHAGWMTSSPGPSQGQESSVFGGPGYGDASPGTMGPPHVQRRGR